MTASNAVTDAEVEAAARALNAVRRRTDDWDIISENWKNLERNMARAALEAAARLRASEGEGK